MGTSFTTVHASVPCVVTIPGNASSPASVASLVSAAVQAAGFSLARTVGFTVEALQADGVTSRDAITVGAADQNVPGATVAVPRTIAAGTPYEPYGGAPANAFVRSAAAGTVAAVITVHVA